MSEPRSLRDLIVGPGATVDNPTPNSKFWEQGSVAVPVGAKPKEMGWGEFIDSIGRKVAAGVSLGWADEAAAGMDALTQPLLGRGSGAPTMGERYNQNLAQEQGRDKAFETEFPATATTAEIGGNIAGAVATPMGRMFEAATIPGRMLKGAGGGAAIGSVAGAGAADPGKRTEGAVTGAQLGGAVGGAIPAVGALAERVGPRILDAFGMRNADKGAVHQLLRAAERDGVSPEEAIKRFDAWQASGQKPEALVDLFGENVRNLAAVAANTPGQARTAAMDLVTSRKAGAPERVGNDVGKAISPNTDYSGTVDDLMRGRGTNAQPLYDKAHDVPTWSPRLQEFTDDPVMKEGMNRGMKMLRLEAVAEGKPFNPQALGVDLDEAGNVILKGVPNMRVLDAAKRGLDDILEKYRDGTTGRLNLTPEGRAIDQFRRAYLDELDALNPAYKEARAAWSGPTQSREAMALGRSILKGDVDITAKKIASMDPGDKEFLRIGVAKALQDAVENTADGRDVVASFFNKPALRKKLEAAFDSPDQFKAFETLMKREQSMAATNNVISPRAGSQTGRLEAGARDMQTDPVGAFSSLMHGNMTGLVRALAPSLKGNQRMNSSTADALAPLLFKTDPAEVRGILGTLSASGPRYPAINDAGGSLMRALMGPVPSMQAGDMGAPKRPLRIEVRPQPLRSANVGN